MRRRGVALAFAAAVGVGACRGDAPTAPETAKSPLYYLKAPTDNGDAQIDTAGRTLRLPFRVLVERGDKPEPGVTVKWEIAGDTLVGVPAYVATSQTDGNGIATSPFRLTLGTVAGPYAARASIAGVSVGSPLFILSDAPCSSALCFTATALPDKPIHVSYVSGDGQIDTVGTTVEADYVVQTTDVFGNPSPGAVIDWAVTSGGGTITPAQSITSGPRAYARARHTLGPMQATQQAVAKARNLPDTTRVNFTVIAFTLLPVASVSLEPESASVNLSKTARFTATLKDENGGTVIWRHITWTTGDPTIATVDTSGLVRGTSVGSTSVIAESEGVSDTSVITVNPGPPPALFAAIVAGGQHVCGLKSDGKAYCWGSNNSGQLGISSAPQSTTPVAVTGSLAFTQLVAGGEHTCGLTASGTAYCWGRGDDGQLGNGLNANRSLPIAVAGNLTFSSLGNGEGYTCGVTSAGQAYCWGSNFWGQLGNGGFSDSPVPRLVAGNLHFVSIAPGFGWHACGIIDTGASYCWGHDAGYAVGVDPPTVTTPQPVPGGLLFTRVVTGFLHTCGLTDDAAVYCWGDNHVDQLGDGFLLSHRSTPGPVTGGSGMSMLTAGESHNCMVSTAGIASCWGANGVGQLGDGSLTQRSTPVPVSGGYTFSLLTAGSGYTCGLTTSGAAYCWGSNTAGQLGDGTTTDSPLPVRVVSGP